MIKHLINVDITKFDNIKDDGTVLSSTYGYRIYDSCETKDYCNLFDSLEELNKQPILDIVKEYNPMEFALIEIDCEFILNGKHIILK